MNSSPLTRSRCGAFTLIELLVTVGIISLLATMAVPQLEAFRKRAEATRCSSNLRQIGIATLGFVAENGGRYPKVESQPSDPIYSGDVEADGEILELLGEYGVTSELLRCLSDVSRNNYFAIHGSSYQWSVLSGDEPASAIKVYGRRGVRVREPSRVTLAHDFTANHKGRQNRLYADGSVRDGWSR